MEGHALQLSCLALRPFWGAVPSESHSARHFCLIRIIRTMRRLLCISWAAASPKRMKIITTSCTTGCQERHPVCCSVRIDGTFLYAAAARPELNYEIALRSAMYLRRHLARRRLRWPRRRRCHPQPVQQDCHHSENRHHQWLRRLVAGLLAFSAPSVSQDGRCLFLYREQRLTGDTR